MRKNLIKLIVCVGVVSLSAFLPAGDQGYLYRQTQAPLTDRLLEWVAEQPGFDALETIEVVVLEGALRLAPDTADPVLRDLLTERFASFGDEHGKDIEWVVAYGPPPPLSLTFHPDEGKARLVSMWRPPGRGATRAELAYPYYRPLALLPPLLAIVLALTFRQTLLALFAGVWIGASIVPWFNSAMTIAVISPGTPPGAPPPVPVPQVAGTASFPNPLLGLWRFVAHYFWELSVKNTFRIEIIGFVAVLPPRRERGSRPGCSSADAPAR